MIQLKKKKSNKYSLAQSNGNRNLEAALSHDGDLPASLDNLIQCSLTVLMEGCRIIPNLIFPCINCCLLLLLLPPRTSRKSLAQSSLHPPLSCGVSIGEIIQAKEKALKQK